MNYKALVKHGRDHRTLRLGFSCILLVSAGSLEAATFDIGTAAGSANVGGSHFFPLLESGTTITAQAAGSGLFNPFLQYQANGTEQGFNTSTGSPLDTKSGPGTKDIQVSDLNSYTYNGVDYYAFGLDINESSTGGYQSLDKLEVWVKSSPLSSPTDYSSLSSSGATRVFDLDGVEDTTLLLDYNLTGSGSGTADYLFLLPKSSIDSAVGAASWNVIFYAQQGAAGTVGGNDYTTDAGFEEWSIVSGYSSLTPPPVVGDFAPAVPEESTYAAGVFMAGILFHLWYSRRRKACTMATDSEASVVSYPVPSVPRFTSGFEVGIPS